jgi:hypothetical protein
MAKATNGNEPANANAVNIDALRSAVQGLRSMAEAQKRYYAFGTKAYPQLHAYLTQMEAVLGIQPNPEWGKIPQFH